MLRAVTRPVVLGVAGSEPPALASPVEASPAAASVTRSRVTVASAAAAGPAAAVASIDPDRSADCCAPLGWAEARARASRSWRRVIVAGSCPSRSTVEVGSGAAGVGTVGAAAASPPGRTPGSRRATTGRRVGVGGAAGFVEPAGSSAASAASGGR